MSHAITVPRRLQAHYRGATAALALKKLDDASRLCRLGLGYDPKHTDLNRLYGEIRAVQQRETAARHDKIFAQHEVRGCVSELCVLFALPPCTEYPLCVPVIPCCWCA